MSALPHAPAQEPSCPLCGVSRRQWVDLGGRRKAQCPSCGSAERHRALAHAWIDGLQGLMPLRGRRVLAMRPDRADLAFLKLFGARPMTFDLMPRGSPDMVGDLGRLRLPNDRFDMVFSNVMLATARDPEAAVREIARVLRPDGVALFYESAELGQPTREILDHGARIAWYGQEMFERYGVAQYREWGFADLEALLSAVFHVRLVETADPPTGRRFVWFWCTRRPPASEAPFLSPADRAALLAAWGGGAPGPGAGDCALCRAAFDGTGNKDRCPGCDATSRQRSLAEVVRDYLPQVLDPALAETLPMLVQGSSAGEQSLLAGCFPNPMPADIRDLDHVADGATAGVVAMGAFDLDTDAERLLRDALRVTAPGGGFACVGAPHRLLAGTQPPMAEQSPSASPAYDEPVGGAVLFGREWFLDAMVRAGWAAGAVPITDRATGLIHTWFLGRKPLGG